MKSQEYIDKKKTAFNEMCQSIFSELSGEESLTLILTAEQSLFSRFNQSKIRQSTTVEQSEVLLKYISNNREVTKSVSICWDKEHDLRQLTTSLGDARREVSFIPENPYIVYPKNSGSSEQDTLLEKSNGPEVIENVVKPIQDADLAGMLADGIVIRANQNSKGQKHWFSTENFFLDYSLYSSKQKAVKSCYAGTTWNQDDYEANISNASHQLSQMRLPVQEVRRGNYKTYLAPAAVNEIFGTMKSWRGWSGSSYKRGRSPLKELMEKSKTFSDKVTITEDFTQGLSPKFNDLGEVSVDVLPVIERGELKNLMVCSKTAKEYDDLKDNGAGSGEGLRSPHFHSGDLAHADILEELDTGLFVSNLHYLNFSDLPKGRITGMTRFACFWVENAEIKGPIKDLRFDETIYNIFGDNLLGVTDCSEIVPETETYFYRHLGGSRVPGLLVDQFAYTL